MKRKKLSASQLFLFLSATVALAGGFSDSVLSNFFKDAYNVNASMRAFIEFPRETPGMLCVLVFALLGFLGDIKLAFIAQMLSLIGITVLGLMTPSFALMLVYLFIFSLGQHIYLPLTDSIGMSMSEKDKVGQQMGQYASVRTFCGMLAAFAVFIGFKAGKFTFKTPVKPIFLISTCLYALAAVIAIRLYRQSRQEGKSITMPDSRSQRFIFRREYIYFYLLTILRGVQKQIAFVFGSWVIIDILEKGADVMSVLSMTSSLIGIFFIRFIGKCMDKFGIRKMMYVDALSYIFVYLGYGLTVALITGGKLTGAPAAFLIYLLYILDNLSMQTGMVRSLYLRKIAVNESEVTRTLSTGTSLDHIVSIIASQVSGLVWTGFGPQYVFFIAAFFSLGNLYVACRVQSDR